MDDEPVVNTYDGTDEIVHKLRLYAYPINAKRSPWLEYFDGDDFDGAIARAIELSVSAEKIRDIYVLDPFGTQLIRVCPRWLYARS